jgi:nucleoside 2-deoxyribosyltransferase
MWPKVASIAREYHERGERLSIVPRPGCWEDRPGALTPEQILDLFPRTVLERMDRTLLNFGAATQVPGRWVEVLEGAEQFFYAEDEGALIFLRDQLLNGGYIDQRKQDARKWRLTAKGWQRVFDLTREAERQQLTTGFIAMSFGDGMAMAAAALHQGVEAAGYQPFIIRHEQFNHDIHDGVIAGIRRARFVVADMTGQRQNVYYEAGFAEGLGKPVIYTCRRDCLDGQADSERMHFDIRNRNVIVWEAPDTLPDRLQMRIESTIGRPEALAGAASR